MLNVVLDHAQYRVDPGRPRLQTLITGGYEKDLYTDVTESGWSPFWGTKDSNDEFLTYFDKITGCIFPTPYPMLKAWNENSTGSYARFGIADYTLTSAEWRVEKKTDDYATFLVANDATFSEEVRTSASLVKNRAVYIGFFVHGWGSSNGGLKLTCGWGTTSSGVYIEVQNGKFWVYKDGELVGGPYNLAGDQTYQSSEQKFVKLFLIPCRSRDLLVLSDSGGGAVHSFTDIAEDDDDPTITPAAPFFWQVEGGKAEVECALIKCATSVYRSSIKCIFAAAPPTGSSPTTEAFFSPTFMGTASVAVALRNVSADTAFVPDGLTKECRIKATITSDGDALPFVHAAVSSLDAELLETNDEEALNVTSTFLTQASLEVPEAPGGVRFSITLKEPEAIEEISDRAISTISNRPIMLAHNIDSAGEIDLIGANDVMIINGIGDSPKLVDHWNDEVRRVTIDVRDKWKLLENYRFKDPVPLDGLNVGTAIRKIANAAGFHDDELDIGTITVTIPTNNACGRGDWTMLITPDQTAADAILRIHEAYLADYFIGIVPQPSPNLPKLTVKSQTEMGAEPILTLFDNAQSAYEYGISLSETDAEARANIKARVYYEYTEEPLEPEANEVWVEGIDRKTRRPVLAYAEDLDSMSLTDAPSMRPDNWLGERRRYGLAEPAFGLTSECEAAVAILFRRLSVVRYMAEIKTQFLINPSNDVPIWKGQCIRLQNKGIYRIQTLSVEGFQEDAVVRWRPATYVLERIVDEREDTTGLGYTRTMGTSLAALKLSHMFGIVQFGKWGTRTETKRPPISQSQV